MYVYSYTYHKDQANVGIYTSPMDPMSTGISIHKICMTTGVQPEHRHVIFSTENPAWEPTFGLRLSRLIPKKCLVVFLWKYLCTQSPTGLYFSRSTLQKKAIFNQNKGHLRSRYIYIFWVFPMLHAKTTKRSTFSKVTLFFLHCFSQMCFLL